MQEPPHQNCDAKRIFLKKEACRNRMMYVLGVKAETIIRSPLKATIKEKEFFR